LKIFLEWQVNYYVASDRISYQLLLCHSLILQQFYSAKKNYEYTKTRRCTKPLWHFMPSCLCGSKSYWLFRSTS